MSANGPPTRAFRSCRAVPYGIAKTAAHMLVVHYREQHGLFASNGILFNHESPLRPTRYVTRKIVVRGAGDQGREPERLRLGRLDICRDWGWAPEYVEAMWLTLQADEPDDYVVATGQMHSLEEFAAAAFGAVGLDWRSHVELPTRPCFVAPTFNSAAAIPRRSPASSAGRRAAAWPRWRNGWPAHCPARCRCCDGTASRR